jgi:lipopolysaccharide transport system permease protein
MTPSIATSLYELPEYRQVLANLIARDLKVKYQSKALGFAWSLLAPAAMLAILFLIFGGRRSAFKDPMPDYWAFLICGILPFQFIAESIVTGAGSIRGSAGIIRKVYVPMEILVIASISVKTIEFILQMLLAVVLLMVLHHGMGTHEKVKTPLPPAAAKFVSERPHFAPLKTAVVLPGAIILTYLFVLGLSFPLAAWCVIYKDLDHIIAIVMRVLFYATPVFWAIVQVEGNWVRWAWINPIADILDLYRGPMYWGAWPFNEALGGGPVKAWGVAILFTVLVLVGGYGLFNRSKQILAEVV